MSSSFHTDAHEDARVPRVASRAGSISTLWSSAEVPFCLDPRVHSTADAIDHPAGSYRTHPISYNSARSSQVSMDFARMSIDIPDEYPRRPDSIRLSPPRPSASSSASSGSSPSRVPSFNIGTIDEDAPMQSSPISRLPYQPPSFAAQSRLLASRFSEDTIDERPLIPHSSSQGTFGPGLSELRNPSASSDHSASASSRSSSVQDASQLSATMRQNDPPQPKHLYRRAYRFFDETYSVQPPAQPSLADVDPLEPPSAASSTSQNSHSDSLLSCSRSHTSSHATSSDSASASSINSSQAQFGAMYASSSAMDAYSTPSPGAPTIRADTTVLAKQHAYASGEESDRLSIPSLPSLPSFNSAHTATRAAQSGHLRLRPSTADVYSQEQPVSPHTFPVLALPLSRPVPSPTEDVRYEIRSYGLTPSAVPVMSQVDAGAKPAASRAPVKSRLLRARVASTPKLRLDASSLFATDQPQVPPLPVGTTQTAADRRPSTAQMDGRAPFFGRRFRSRTLGESDRVEASHMQSAARTNQEPPASAHSRASAGSSSAAPTPNHAGHRHPSQVSATSSELFSPHDPMQPTPGSSICSASSPATTNSSLPVTPRTTSTFPRPKSRGIGSASKAGGSGWASYLNSGLTLHLEHDHGRAVPIAMTYLAYDPFGRPEQLVEGTEAARVMTPKRPKSRGDKDQEAEQSGTLEFGPLDEGETGALLFDVARKSDGSALLKHLTVGDDTKADLLTRQAALSLKTLGNHHVAGYERKGRLAWKLAYRVEHEPAHPDRRRLVPLRFSCSATLLNPERARKSRLLNLVKKQVAPSLASKAVASGAVLDSPGAASLHFDLGSGASTAQASPSSSRRAQTLLSGEQPASPIRRSPGVAGGSAPYNSPLRQPSRAGASFASATSADSSYSSQPATPGRDGEAAEGAKGRMHLQASPVSAHFGQPSPGARHLRSMGAMGAAAAMAPALQLDLGVDAHAARRLQAKPSVNSLASSVSSGGLHSAKPIIVNGRKLIPISLPAGLARQNRIDPALLQANVVSPASSKIAASYEAAHAEARQRSTSMNSTSSSGHRVAAPACLLSSQPRTSGGTASRPPTASESIKLEYLARTTSGDVAGPMLRPQKSFAGAVLAPSAFADESRHARRPRSRTIEADHVQARRPFTADAWGEAQYPLQQHVSNVRAKSQQHPVEQHAHLTSQGPLQTRDDATGKIIPRQLLASSFDRFADVLPAHAGTKTLPAPPRPQTRPRTAQTITQASEAAASRQHAVYHIQPRPVHAARS